MGGGGKGGDWDFEIEVVGIIGVGYENGVSVSMCGILRGGMGASIKWAPSSGVGWV